MFVACYDTGVIERWGRWKSARFTTYFRNEDRVLARVRRGMMLATCLLPKLQRQPGDDRNKERIISDGGSGWKVDGADQVAVVCSKFRRGFRNCVATMEGFIAEEMDLLDSPRYCAIAT